MTFIPANMALITGNNYTFNFAKLVFGLDEAGLAILQDHSKPFSTDDIAALKLNIQPSNMTAERIKIFIEGTRHHHFESVGMVDIPGEQNTEVLVLNSQRSHARRTLAMARRGSALLPTNYALLTRNSEGIIAPEISAGTNLLCLYSGDSQTAAFLGMTNTVKYSDMKTPTPAVQEIPFSRIALDEPNVGVAIQKRLEALRHIFAPVSVMGAQDAMQRFALAYAGAIDGTYPTTLTTARAPVVMKTGRDAPIPG